MYRKILPYLMGACPFISYAQATDLTLYRPFADVPGQVRLTTISQKGRCWQQSNQLRREDAWHCTADDGVTYDPCFSKAFASASQVICPFSPWDSKAILLTIDKPLNNQQDQSLDMSRDYPWAIELVTGERCIAVTPGKMIEDLPLRYDCGHNIVLLGNIQRCTPIWKITLRSGENVSEASIKEVWF